MNTRRTLRCKKGMTLVELLVALAIMGILVMVTITMLVASGNLFAEQANMTQCKQIGDACLDWVADGALYGHYVAIQGSTAYEEETVPYELFYTSDTGATPLEKGRLYAKMKDGAQAIDVFGEDFYMATTVSFTFTPLLGEETALKIGVTVWQAQTEAYFNEKTINLINAQSITGTQSAGQPAVLLAAYPLG